MDYPMTFAVLLYINVFYFGLYSVVEFLILMTKGYSINDSRYNLAAFLNEVFILAFMVVVESLRLFLGQRHAPADFNKQLSAVFQILVLTLPSMYSVAYFTFWQNKVTSLDIALGLIMLAIQSAQFLSAFLQLWPKLKPASGQGQVRYTRIRPVPPNED